MGDRTRTPRAMGQLTVGSTDDNEGIGTTIVGGQPPRVGRRPAASIPVGIERVLYAAAVDRVFRDELLADRAAAPGARGLALTDSEQAMLRVIPEVQLLATIEGMDTSPENLERRSFMQVVAAGAVTVAAGEVVAGCTDDDDDKVPSDMAPTSEGFNADRGIRPDGLGVDSPATQGIRPGPDSAGILPDLPSGVNGIQPDLPPGVKEAGPVDIVVAPEGSASYGIRPKG